MKIYEAYSELQARTGEIIAGVPIPAVEDGVKGDGFSIRDTAYDGLETIESVVSANPAASLIIGATVGLGIGTYSEYRAKNKTLANREKLSSIHADIVEEEPNASRPRIALKSAASLAAIGGLTFGLINTKAWINEDSEQVIPPSIEVAVDKSGATYVPNDDSAIAVRSIVGQIDETLDEFESRALVASSGVVSNAQLSEAASSRPFGSAPMEQAFASAIDNVTIRNDLLVPGEQLPNNAIIVVTDGNEITGTLTDENIEEADAPVYVFNVDPDGVSEDSLREVAELTKGEYFDLDSLDTIAEREAAIKQVGKSITESQKDVEQKPNWLQRGLLMTGTLALYGLWAKDRPKLTSNVKYKKRATKEKDN